MFAGWNCVLGLCRNAVAEDCYNIRVIWWIGFFLGILLGARLS